MERTITGDFHEKKVVTKTILQFAQKIDIIKKTIAHKVYKMLLIATLIPDCGLIGESISGNSEKSRRRQESWEKEQQEY